jgi:hypothetical protein
VPIGNAQEWLAVRNSPMNIVLPLITRSEHEARTQWQLMHTFEAQPEGAAHPALAAGAVVAKSPLLVADALRAAIGDAIGVRVADLFLDTII